MQRYRSYVLPFAILLGLFLHSYISRIAFIVPYLIGMMLFFTYSSIQVSKMHIHRFDIWLILFQLLASIGVYLIIKPCNLTMAEGALVTILTPTATSAVVIAVLLGGNLTTMGVYTLLSNLAVAVVAPLYFSLIGTDMQIPFFESFGLIIAKIAPLL
ncbi:MAG: transporter, partial [Bacteroidales bacterium]|nr:transporter [Bacteroidales bacterium]